MSTIEFEKFPQKAPQNRLSPGAPPPTHATPRLAPFPPRTHRLLQSSHSQAFMFLAMEPPHVMSASAIIESKVALLKAVKTLTMRDETTFLGQFGCGNGEKGYLDDETVPAG